MRKRKPIEFNEALNDAAERLQMFRRHEVNQAIAWWVAAELVRRHPGRLRLVHTHPHQYDCISVYHDARPDNAGESDWHHLMWLNQLGHITLDNNGRDTDGRRYTWPEVLACESPRDYVVAQLERACGLRVPQQTPPTSTATIGPRIISAFLVRTIFSARSWTMVGGVSVNEHDTSVNEHLFAEIPEANRARMRDTAGEVQRKPETRYWFLTTRGPKPNDNRVFLAIDCADGLLYPKDGPVSDLMDEYGRHRRVLDALVNAFFPPVG
jgi:hypothetical protein